MLACRASNVPPKGRREIMTISDLAHSISTHMLINDRTWTIANEAQHPSAEDVQICLDRAREVLYADHIKDGAELFVGGLIIKREANHMDVYIYLGTMNEEQKQN
jgi:hypothetical protein